MPQGKDTKLRVVLNRIEYYRNDARNQATHPYPDLFAAVRDRDPGMLDQLNWFFTGPTLEPSYTGHASLGGVTYIGQDSFMHTFYKQSKVDLRGTPLEFFHSTHFAHELAHVFGVRHLYASFGGPICDEADWLFVYDAHGCGEDKLCPYPVGNPDNNVMGGGGRSFSTLQIAVMHHTIKEFGLDRYLSNCCHNGCVAVGLGKHRHSVEGPEDIMFFGKTYANEPWAWNGQFITVPSSGVYQMSLSFQKDALYEGSTYHDVWMRIRADTDILGTVWSESTDGKPNSFFYTPPNGGRRDSVSMTMNAKLEAGQKVFVTLGAHQDRRRHVVDTRFSFNKLCC